MYLEFLDRSNMSEQPDEMKEARVPYALDFPIAPAWFSDPPKGTIDDGIRLSLRVFLKSRNRPEIFEERARQRVDVEFVM